MENQMNSQKYVSVKPTPQLWGILKEIEQLEPHLARAELLETVCRWLKKSEAQINFHYASKYKFKFKEDFYEKLLPDSLKIRISDYNLYDDCRNILKDAFQLTRVTSPFFLRIVLTAYYLHLRRDKKIYFNKISDESKPETENLDAQKIILIKEIYKIHKGDEDMKENENIFLRHVDRDTFNTHPDTSMLALGFYDKMWRRNKHIELSGDTIISTKTALGMQIRVLDVFTGKFEMPGLPSDRLDIIMKFREVSEETKKGFKELSMLTHTLANFWPLPRSFQHIRSAEYHEFFDLFLNDVRNYYMVGGKTDQAFSENKNNKDWVDSFGEKAEGWKNFVTKNYLECFFEDSEKEGFMKCIKLAPAGCSSMPMPYGENWARGLSEEEKNKIRDMIKKDMAVFVRNANQIIKNRGEQLQKAILNNVLN